MSILRGRLAAEAEARAVLSGAAALSQRQADPPATSGSDHLPMKYDRDAVQVALDSVLGQLSGRLLALEARRGG